MVEKILELLTFPGHASAHEVYVLSPNQIQAGLAQRGPNFLPALWSSQNIHLTSIITLCVVTAYGLSLWFRQTQPGRQIVRALERLAPVGLVAVRLAIAISLLYGAATNAFFGPELRLASLSAGPLLRIIEATSGALLLVGLFSEIAALLSLIAVVVLTTHIGGYIVTYLNYIAELLVVLLFGSRVFSLDRRLFGPSRRWPKFAQWETTIVRIGYGIALIYAAMYIKVIHSALTLDVVNDYHLTRFHWLFPADPHLIVAGGALAETAIGLFILLGLELRLTVIISLFYLTLSLIFFREAVWPHLILYGISINLLVAPERASVDQALDGLWRKWFAVASKRNRANSV